VGKSALTQMAHVGVHLTRVGSDAFDLSVFRGFSESFWEWLTEQAEEFGYFVR
jgi:sarcosine oxidase subunit gamma